MMKAIEGLTRFLAHYIKYDKGNVAVLTGLTIPIIIGFGALAYEVGYWYQAQQRLQHIADVGAFGGAYELSIRGDTDLVSRVEYLASENNFVNNIDGDLVVDNPPISGAYTTDDNAVEVNLTRALGRSLSSVFYSTPVTINARAVATLRGGPACVYSLSKTASGAFSVNGTVNVNLSNCGIAVNSSSPSALSGVGSATINASFVNVVGGDSFNSNVTVNTDSGDIVTNGPAYPNPLSDVSVSGYPACTETKKLTINSTKTINPGVFCGGVSIGGSGTTVTMTPGTYYIEGKSFTLTGGSNLIADGVTIVLSGQNTGNYPTLDISGGNTVTINAPTSGPYANIAILQDPKAPSSGTNKLTGNSVQNISGAIYFPRQNITYSGNSNPASPCVLLVADTVTLNGTSSMTCDPGDLGNLVKPAALSLVE